MRKKLKQTSIIFFASIGLMLTFSSSAFAVDRGFILVDPEYPHSFKFQNGDRYFPMGDTSYYLLGQEESTIESYLDSRSAHHFNFIRIGAVGEGFWPFGGSPSSPDFSQINETALQKLDRVFDYAATKDINIELLIWTYGNEGGNGMWGNATQENFWIDTLVNRYKNRHNLFMFTVTNEFERYPDGNYSYSSSDVDWVRNVAARIKSIDSVHPVGAHPSVWISFIPPHNGFLNYGSFTQHLPQVVGPLWQGSSLDVQNVQNNQGVQANRWSMSQDDCGAGITGCVVYESTDWQSVTYPVSWTATGWDFEGAGMEDSIAQDWAQGKPVVNTEFGYQYETGAESYTGYRTRQVHQPQTVRKKAWKIATAGGFFAAGFDNAAVTFRDFLNWRPEQLETLYNFFTTKTEYWKLAPHLDLVGSANSLLALPGVEYIGYFPRGGTNDVDLLAGNYLVEWLNPETGEYISAGNVSSSGGEQLFTPPEDASHDWVLHLLAAGVSAPSAPSGLAVR